MSKKYILVIGLWMAVLWHTKPTQAQATLVETVEARPGEMGIAYKKFVLPNGLVLLVHEDHSDPLVHVDVTYHVGSAREEIGKSGFAHFFEHMMFQGSEHVGDEMHFKYISEAGGTLNGTTNRDRTNYFETLPRNGLEMALWLEADRMGFLLDSVTQRKFEIQRETVKNERGQRYDNVPYGLMGENTAKYLYPYGHPYSWLTIGYIEDLNRVDVSDLKKFFMRWYGPNNATLTVGGDVNTQEVVKLVEKYFGPLKRGPEVKKADLAGPVLQANRFRTMEDNIRFPVLQVTWPGVPMGHPDEAALDYLASLLSSGRSSPLYRCFKDGQQALQANASHQSYELAGEMLISIRTFPGKSLATMDSLLTITLKEFEKKGIGEEDMTRIRTHYEKQFVERTEGVADKVRYLAAYNTYFGNANLLHTEYENYMNVTAADVMRVFNQYVKNRPALRLSVCPKGKQNLAVAPDNYEVSSAGYVQPKNQYKRLRYKKAKDSFDRGKVPASAPMMGIPMQPFNEQSLTGGTKMAIMPCDQPVTKFQIVLRGGHLLDAQDTTLNGLANLTAAMLSESTKRHTAAQLSDELGKLGSNISINSGEEAITIEVECLSKNLRPTVAFLMERLTEPAFDSISFVRVKKQLIEEIGNRSTQPVAIANAVFAGKIYTGTIKALPEAGTEHTVAKITLANVHQFYQKYINPSQAFVVAVSNLDQGTVATELEFLMANWPATAYTIPSLPREYKQGKTMLYLVNKDDAAQTELRVGSRSLAFDGYSNFYKATLMNYPLGGGFNSRINQNLREKNGWTYGARTAFIGTASAGHFAASTGVKRQATDSAVAELMKELKNYKLNGATAEEANYTRNSQVQGEALKYERSGQKLAYLRMMTEYNLPPELAMKRMEVLSSLNAKEISNTAMTWVPDNVVIVVVGDKKNILPGLQRLGYEITELNMDGSPR